LFLLAALCGLCYAQSNPFLTAPGTRWQGRINYTDAASVRHSDLYEVIFVPNGTCIVSVSTKENGRELFQDGDGLWSYDENTPLGSPRLHIECNFTGPVIERLPAIRWVSVYQFDALKNRFTLLVPPYPDAKNNVRVQFVKVTE
jgi:hypothetical protein